MQMKKTLLILLTILLSGGMLLQAEPVSENRAREIAMKVLAAQPATKAAAGDVKLIWNGEDAVTKAAAQPAFYVFGSDRGGFVIIAGDDNVQPVLAVSETKHFKVEGMPDNVRWWMDGLKQYVRSAAVPTSEVRSQWAVFADTKSDPVAADDPLITDPVIHSSPEWDQGNDDYFVFGRQVFNTKCPLDASSKRTVTGCVTTALGELLTVLSGLYPDDMPAHASATQVNGYTGRKGYVTAATPGNKYNLAYFYGVDYDWAGLRSLTDTEAIIDTIVAGDTVLLDNLAWLLADVGAMVRSLYSADGTVADTDDVTYPMGEFMGINKGAFFDVASAYTARQWKEKLKAELARHPVLYAGNNDVSAGHAFVLDGYARYNGVEDMFYVNFGWGGLDNGYYLLPDFGGFHNEGTAMFNCYPKQTSNFIYHLKFDNNMLPGFQYNNSHFDAESSFDIQACVTNSGNIEYLGKIAAKLVDKNGSTKADFKIYSKGVPVDSYDIDSKLDIGDFESIYTSIQLTGSPSIAFGDKIVLYCTVDEDMTVFEPFDELKDGLAVNELPVMPAAFIKTDPMEYHAGDYFQFELTNYYYVYAGTVWKITAPDGTISSDLAQSSREFQFTQAGTYKVEAAVAPRAGDPVVETITTYITVSE